MNVKVFFFWIQIMFVYSRAFLWLLHFAEFMFNNLTWRIHVCRIQYLQSNFKYANYLNIYLQSWSEFHRWVPLSSDEKLKMWSIYDPKCFNLKKTDFHEKLMEFQLNNYSQRLKGNFKQWKNLPRINHQIIIHIRIGVLR